MNIHGAEREIEMYIGSPSEKIREAKIARSVIDLAGRSMEDALQPINAKSEEQRNFAGDVRLHAIAQIWSEEIDPTYQDAQMAQALLAACNCHLEARFWLDNKDGQFIALLENDIEKALGE